MSLSPSEIEAAVEAQIVDSQKRIEASIRRLEKRILKLTQEFATNANGDIYPPSIALGQAKRIYKETLRAYEQIYSESVKSAIDFEALDAITFETFDAGYAGMTKDALSAAAQSTLDGYNRVGALARDNINQELLNYAVAGGSFDEMQEQIRRILHGTTDKRGIPMELRAYTFTQDSIMRYHRIANDMMAQQVGVDKFKYFGNVMSTTRPFCRQHVGEVKTRQEWDELGQTEWKGKSSSNIFISCGGYGCRHHLIPIFD